jgi:hypothetical protein
LATALCKTNSNTTRRLAFLVPLHNTTFPAFSCGYQHPLLCYSHFICAFPPPWILDESFHEHSDNVSPCQHHRLQPDHLARIPEPTPGPPLPTPWIEGSVCSRPGHISRPHLRSPRLGSHDRSSVILLHPSADLQSRVKGQLSLHLGKGNASASAR